MEECEVLCSSIAIMVNGCFRCLGSTQHLKNRFGDGYTIKIRLKSPSMPSRDQLVLDDFSSNYVLKDRHINILQYEIAEQFVSLTEIFSRLERLLVDGHISDYSVSQNTLDNVFVNFVRDQCDTFQETSTPSDDAAAVRETRDAHANDVLDDTFGDGPSTITRSRRNDRASFNRLATQSMCHCSTHSHPLQVLDCSKL
jgi:hypothetical protein